MSSEEQREDELRYKCVDCGKYFLPDNDEELCEKCFDPTPWCHWCGAMSKSSCHCAPAANND